MEVTVKEVSKCLNLSVLATKEYLIKKRKEGVIFFKDDISSLTIDRSFQLYYYMMPSKKTLIDAFPIPTKAFRIYKNKRESFVFMYQFFKQYYQVSHGDLSFFEQYNLDSPYVGIKYIWFYK